ncbi:hypothetical protein SEA_EESA_51 [Arthrobacter phage Eesa]|nr:hypothetical protein SEA_EESA_51 [Arthrobacter phage Eesa]
MARLLGTNERGNMADGTITTASGSTVRVEEFEGERVVVLDHPDAPDDMRDTVAGRLAVLDGGRGFQPVPFAAFLMSPEVLRAVADLLEREG